MFRNLTNLNRIAKSSKYKFSLGKMLIEDDNLPMKIKKKRLTKQLMKPVNMDDIDYHIETLKRITDFRGINRAPVDVDSI
jgi:hypothetical protein